MEPARVMACGEVQNMRFVSKRRCANRMPMVIAAGSIGGIMIVNIDSDRKTICLKPAFCAIYHVENT